MKKSHLKQIIKEAIHEISERSLPITMVKDGKIIDAKVDTSSGTTKVVYFIVKGTERYSLETSDGVIKKLAF